MVETIFCLVVPLVLLVAFWTAGSANERSHPKALSERERHRVVPRLALPGAGGGD